VGSLQAMKKDSAENENASKQDKKGRHSSKKVHDHVLFRAPNRKTHDQAWVLSFQRGNESNLEAV
jgi:beta-lactamase class A